MTAVVGTIGVIVTGLSALVALGNYVVCDSFAQAVVENEILSDEFAFQSFFLNLLGIINNTTFELVYVFETLVFVIS
jgi:hypothetical protein